MALPAIPIINGAIGLFKTVGSIFQSWQDRKKIVAEGQVKIEEARVEGAVKRAQTIAEGDMQYDNTAAEGMRHSWKDEWFTILLSLPFIMCFIPPLTQYVKAGFEVLRDSTPEWYQWAFIGAIIASFGLKEWFKSKISG